MSLIKTGVKRTAVVLLLQDDCSKAGNARRLQALVPLRVVKCKNDVLQFPRGVHFKRDMTPGDN